MVLPLRAVLYVYNKLATRMSADESEGARIAAHVPTAPLRTMTTAVGLHGAVGIFDPAMEEWSEYSERLGHYFVANDITEAEKK